MWITKAFQNSFHFYFVYTHLANYTLSFFPWADSMLQPSCIYFDLFHRVLDDRLVGETRLLWIQAQG